jgi:hypothetical protein
MVEKYNGHPNQVTDVTRTSIVLNTLDGVIRALDFVLANGDVVRLKNRFNEPELGYSDMLLNIKMSTGFICEVPLHVASVYYVKGRTGHTAFKWFRRLLKDTDVYEGERNIEGAKHGFGKWIGANGDVYEGQWVDDRKHGHGKYTDADGHKYVGYFKNDNREGQCEFVYFDGSTYDGAYANDKKEGYGVFVYADGQKYEGQWSLGKRNGKGVFRYVDSTVYDGQWVNHKRDGKGFFTDASGNRRESLWKADEELTMTGNALASLGYSCCWASPTTDSRHELQA